MVSAAVLLLGGLSLSYRILTAPVDASSASTSTSNTNEQRTDLQTIPPVPPAGIAKSLSKRLRHIEMPVTENIAENPEAAPTVPLSSLPSLNAELVATFVETPVEKSYAVFRVPGQPDKLVAVGQAIDQAGEQFTIVSVDRRSVTLNIRGNPMTISMKE